VTGVGLFCGFDIACCVVVEGEKGQGLIQFVDRILKTVYSYIV
jgi:hypothetical protein